MLQCDIAAVGTKPPLRTLAVVLHEVGDPQPAQRRKRHVRRTARKLADLLGRALIPRVRGPQHTRIQRAQRQPDTRCSSPSLPSRNAPDRGHEHHELNEHLDAQRPLGRLRPPVGRVLENPDRPRRALAHIQPRAPQAPLVQDRQPLPTQRVKRMRYDQRVTTSIGVTRTMRVPSTRSTMAPITSS